MKQPPSPSSNECGAEASNELLDMYTLCTLESVRTTPGSVAATCSEPPHSPAPVHSILSAPLMGPFKGTNALEIDLEASAMPPLSSIRSKPLHNPPCNSDPCAGSGNSNGESAVGRCQSENGPAQRHRSINVRSPKGGLGQLSNCSTVTRNPDVGWTASDVDESACLFWMLSPESTTTLCENQAAQMYKYISRCCQFMDALILSHQAFSGLLVAPRSESNDRMSEADVILRLGQLLCRWCNNQKLGVTVGVHVGPVRSISLQCSENGCPSKVTYVGSGYAGAQNLALHSDRQFSVHLSEKLKDFLRTYSCARFTIATLESYHLEMNTNLSKPAWSRNYEENVCQLKPSEGVVVPFSDTDDAGDAQTGMSFERFSAFLEEHEVKVNLFGIGYARTLEEFHVACTKELKCVLIVRDGKLERVVKLVRISIRFRRGNEDREWELRLDSETKDGMTRLRGQKFAAVISRDAHWKHAVETCIEQKLGLNPAIQAECLEIDMQSYSKQESVGSSQTIPGIETRYESHNIVMNIKDRFHEELNRVGLPAGTAFKAGDGPTRASWTWVALTDDKETELMNMLQEHGQDLSDFPSHAFSELYSDVYVNALATLTLTDNEVVRNVQIVKIWLNASVLGVDHVLVIKGKWQNSCFSLEKKNNPIVMRIRTDASWADAVDEALFIKLGLPPDLQEEICSMDESTYRLSEEINYSPSFPGLKTLYVVHEVRVNVVNPQAAGASLIGLPAGIEFTHARGTRTREEVPCGDGRYTRGNVDYSEYTITHWCWVPSEEFERLSLATLTDRGEIMDDVSDDCTSRRAASMLTEEEFSGRTVPRPKFLIITEEEPTGQVRLASLMNGRETNWGLARRAARRILDPEYSCKDFFEDISKAFPELRLYNICFFQQQSEYTNSGRAPAEEYQRTVGALFAVFWVMRLHLDGKQSFCYGLDSNWHPRQPSACDEEPKRTEFFQKAAWGAITKMVVDSGVLKVQPNGEFVVDEERTLALIVLMVFHDIMKLNPLLPTVESHVDDFFGYLSGEMVGDHDLALSYILTHHPFLLPSFAGLSPEQQSSILFAVCKMDYNMGWLVQAEAPPGALFRTMRGLCQNGQGAIENVALYLLHWFADLAGAEPCPMEGCTKFVLKFPLRVLSQFLESFPVVQNIATQSETRVVEDYLKQCWEQHCPSLGPLLSGYGAIAKMRLVLMSQGESLEILRHFEYLNLWDQHTLVEEMRCTGCADQMYECEDEPRGSKGPAILVYYGPALMQHIGKKEPRGALMLLAEIYRKTRELWPATEAMANDSVIVRIHAVKQLEFSQVLRPPCGQAWVVCKLSSKDAVVKLSRVSEWKSLDWQSHATLKFEQPYCCSSGWESSPAPRNSTVPNPAGRASSARATIISPLVQAFRSDLHWNASRSRPSSRSSHFRVNAHRASCEVDHKSSDS